MKIPAEVQNLLTDTPQAAGTILEKDCVDSVMVLPTGTKQISIEVHMQKRPFRKKMRK